MRIRLNLRLFYLAVAGMLFLAGWLMGQAKATTQKTYIHAAAITALKPFTPDQVENFRKETAALVGKMPGLRRVWFGKLEQPESIDGLRRDYGIILEFEDAKGWENWKESRSSTLAPWYKHLDTLREPGSSHFNVVGK